MMHETSGQSQVLSRRAFCQSAMAAVAVPWVGSVGRAGQTDGKVEFFKNLAPGHLGVNANQKQALEYAVKYGFEGISPNEGEFADKSAAEIGEWIAMMKEKGIRYGAAGLPVEFRRGDEEFQKGMAGLARRAGLMKQLGVTRVATWLMPGHNELTYLQNFKQHEMRLREAAKVLKDNDIRLGLEFVGPRTSRERFRFPFACAQADMMELVQAIGTGNVGLLLDSWHWYTSHGTVTEMEKLSAHDIVHVHVNDAPSGVQVDQQVDNRRKLPVTTGVIDLKGFINTLVKIGYDGPVECEPFDQELRKMDQGAILQTTIDSLNRLWRLIEA
ncbi:MAG: sugar phosphate isomerase/epimerase [Sedimentisphaerales bacterium]|nr:sugar phosphate isomerase/epimerase [Sedimentisphaerales bacterium]